MSLTDRTKPSDVSLNTDLYELTMAQGYWEAGLVDAEACFTAFFRENPFNGGFAISCGTGQIVDLIENFVFEDDDIDYLTSINSPGGGRLFKPAFLEFLRNHKLNVTIDAIPEGELVFPREPMVRVEGSIVDCQLIETALLNLVNFQTLAATKCARVIKAAQGNPVSDFGLRRAQGPDGGLAVARASYIAGASSTSNVLAGKIYGIPVFGTHAHSWVMSFDTELDAFRAFAKSSPTNCSLLLDTYDVHEGIKNAIIVAKEMEERGERLNAVRIDSGDLARLSKEARKAFDRLVFLTSRFLFRMILTSTPSSRSLLRAHLLTLLVLVPSLLPAILSLRLAASISSPLVVSLLPSLGLLLSSCLRWPTSVPFQAFSTFAASTMQTAALQAT